MTRSTGGGRRAGRLLATTGSCLRAMGGAAAQGACAARATTEAGWYVPPRRAAARKEGRLWPLRPRAAAGRRSAPCAAPSAAGNAVAGGPSRAASTRLSLAQRAGEEPPHRRPPTEHARPARAFRATFGSQLTRTHALARQKHALLVAFAESEGGRHEGAPARARPARGCMVGCLYTSEEGVFRNSEFYRRFGCLSR